MLQSPTLLTYFLTSLIAGINMTIYNYKIGHFPDITSLGTFLSKIQPWCKFITANHTQSSNYIIARSITFAIQLSYVTILQCSSTYIVGPLSFLLPLEYCHLSLFPLFFFLFLITSIFYWKQWNWVTIINLNQIF